MARKRQGSKKKVDSSSLISTSSSTTGSTSKAETTATCSDTTRTTAPWLQDRLGQFYIAGVKSYRRLLPLKDKDVLKLSNDEFKLYWANLSENDRWVPYKVNYCKYLTKSLQCTKGDQCLFAHSAAELRYRPDLKNTKMCIRMQRYGYCCDPNCQFAHAKEHMKLPNSKKGLCKLFLLNRCYNENCLYAHSPEDINTSFVFPHMRNGSDIMNETPGTNYTIQPMQYPVPCIDPVFAGTPSPYDPAFHYNAFSQQSWQYSWSYVNCAHSPQHDVPYSKKCYNIPARCTI